MKKLKLKKTLIILLSVVFAVAVGISAWLVCVDTQSKKAGLVTLNAVNLPEKSTAAAEDGNIDVNGVTLHYVVCGEGTPIVLLHGNGSSHHAFDDVIGYLALEHTVYAIDSRCHGESTGTEISYDLMAQDVAAFIEALGLSHPVVIGHSDGGIVGLCVAIKYPDLLGGLVACGANTVPSNLKWYFRLGVKISYALKKSPLDNMMLTEPNITAEQLGAITVPTYVVAGEFDIVKLSDTEFIADSINGSDIAIVKFSGHSGYVHNGKKLYTLVNDWLNRRLPDFN